MKSVAHETGEVITASHATSLQEQNWQKKKMGMGGRYAVQHVENQ